MIDYSTLLFFLRNGKRAQEGEGGRGFVAIGQGAKVVKQICDYDNIFSRGAKSAVKAFKTVAENDKILKSGCKLLNLSLGYMAIVSNTDVY